MGNCFGRDPEEPSRSNKTYPASVFNNLNSPSLSQYQQNSTNLNSRRPGDPHTDPPAPKSQQEKKKRSLEFKNKGNQLFKTKNYKEAIPCYTKAIEIFAGDSTYFSNRAMCYRFLKDWENAEKDSETSMKLDPKNYKAHYLKALCLVERAKVKSDHSLAREAINYLNESLQIYQNMTGTKSDAISEDLSTKLAKAKKIEWLMTKEKTLTELNDTASYLTDLIGRDKKTNPDKKQEILGLLELCKAERQKEYTVTEVPDYLNCKITFELMRDPVVTPEGVCYERVPICEHLAKNGPKDPLSRNPLRAEDLIENKAIKDAIKLFTEQNPWSFDFLAADEKFADIDI